MLLPSSGGKGPIHSLIFPEAWQPYRSYSPLMRVSISVCTACGQSCVGYPWLWLQEMLASTGFINTPRTQAAAQTLFSVSLAGNDLFTTDILRVHYTSRPNL